jgi:MYXO-CTERM domain-containing protein
LASIWSSFLSSVFSSALLLSVVVALAGGCAPDSVEHVESRARAVSLGADPGNLDILFMIDNSSSMTSTQMKLLTQDPSFMTVLENLPNGLPNIHVAVVSSDMGAPGDSTSAIECTTTGDNGVFQSTPRGTCTNTTLASGATFISNVNGEANYTGNLTDVFGCIAQLGQNGCGFEHQLAAVARALGADGSPPPTQNVGFLRDDAELAIVLLTNEDDCSAPSNTTLYSLNSGQQNIANPLGPIANYRCNQFGHLCMDPASAAPTALIAPPLNPPADAQGTATAPTLNMTNCESNDTGSGMLTSVADLVAGIKALKADPDNQIVVGAIAPPVTPYTVAWIPESGGQNTQPGELWPLIEHSCGEARGDDVNPLATQLIDDGSFGDPGVRIAQWVHAFGTNGVVASICDADYSISFQTIADKIGMHLQGSGTGGAGGASGGGAGAGGHANVGGSPGAAGAGGAAGSGLAGNGGPGGAGGIVGGTGGSGLGGNGGPGTGGTGAAGAGGNGAQSGATGGQAGTGAQSATGGVSGAAGTGGSAAAGASGAGTGGNAAAGTSGTGTGGTAAAGASGSGTGGAAAAGASGTGTGGAAAAGASGSGTGGAAAAGASGTGSGGAGGHSDTGGHAGNGSGTGGTTEGASSGGCSCDTGGSSPTGVGLGLFLGGLALLATRRRGASKTT